MAWTLTTPKCIGQSDFVGHQTLRSVQLVSAAASFADQKADKTCWSASISCSCAKGWDDKGQRMSWKTAECPTQQSKIWQPSRSLTHSDHSFFFLNFGGGAGGVPIGRSGTGGRWSWWSFASPRPFPFGCSSLFCLVLRLLH